MIQRHKLKSHHKRRLANEAKTAQTLSFKPPQGGECRMYPIIRLCGLAQEEPEQTRTQPTYAGGAENA